MITDGVLTYGYRNGDITSWRFSNDVLNEIVIAALLTILSYQMAETLINLCLGFKRRGEAKLPDIQILLLIRKSSPVAVIRSIFSRTRRRSELDGVDEQEEEEEEEISNVTERENRKILQPLVYSKLFFLFLAIPLINIVTLGLSLERDSFHTFADANFGGLAFGLDMEQSISQWSPISSSSKSICEGTVLQTNTAEFAIAEFSSCVLEVQFSKNSEVDTIRVTLSQSPVEIEQVHVRVAIGSQRVDYMKRVSLLSQPANSSLLNESRRLYYLASILSEEQADLLAKRGLDHAKAYCDSIKGSVQIKRDPNNNRTGGWALSRSVGCWRESERSEKEDSDSAKQVALKVLSVLSFVNSDDLLVRDADAEFEGLLLTFVRGDDLLLLKRRRGFVSVPLLAIAAIGAIVLRTLSELITKNDVERGIGLIVRDGLGLPCCDSMLCSPDVVARYNSRGDILYIVEREYRP